MEKLIDIIAEVLYIDKSTLTAESNRESIEEWDSLAHIQIVAELEDVFEIKIPFEEIMSINKISDFLKYIEVI